MTIAVTQSNTLAIANFFIRKSLKEDNPITQIKLQKLIYFAHGFYLALKERALVNEKIEAWKYGPVIPFIYNKFKVWGNKPIKSVLIDNTSLIIRYEDVQFLELVWHKFAYYSASQLIELSHEEGGPWDVAYKKEENKKGQAEIINQDIYSYFNQNYIHRNKTKAYAMA